MERRHGIILQILFCVRNMICLTRSWVQCLKRLSGLESTRIYKTEQVNATAVLRSKRRSHEIADALLKPVCIERSAEVEMMNRINR